MLLIYPVNFASTANALEELAFGAKDAVLVVDDFVPTGQSSDAGLHLLAERVFRSAGNGQGRARISAPTVNSRRDGHRAGWCLQPARRSHVARAFVPAC